MRVGGKKEIHDESDEEKDTIQTFTIIIIISLEPQGMSTSKIRSYGLGSMSIGRIDLNPMNL